MGHVATSDASIVSATRSKVAGLVREFVRQMIATAPAGPAERDPADPRVRRTRAALLAAFRQLFLEEGYEAITPDRIAAAAGVGRSTFYEHHGGKADLLSQSVAAVLQPLAEAAAGREPPSIVSVLRHFWDNRQLARRMLEGRAGAIVRRRLSELIEQALREEQAAGPVPLALQAASVAAAQLTMVELWLSGRFACTAEQVAQALAASPARSLDAPSR